MLFSQLQEETGQKQCTLHDLRKHPVQSILLLDAAVFALCKDSIECQQILRIVVPDLLQGSKLTHKHILGKRCRGHLIVFGPAVPDGDKVHL